MRVEGSSLAQLNSYDYVKHLSNTFKTSNFPAEVSSQVQQSKDMMLQLLEFAFYKQQNMNLKLVRIVGELYQGKNLDAYA